jgi:hypothetical protein
MLRAAVALGAVVLVGVVGVAVLNADAGDDTPDLTPKELSRQVGATWQSELRDAQRKKGLEGVLRVVRVDCVNEPNSHFTCLAHVAGSGEARRLAPGPITITGRHGGGGGWVARERE